MTRSRQYRDRRKFLALSGLSLVALSSCKSRSFSEKKSTTMAPAATSTPGTARYRREWSDLSPEEQELYRKAVTLLQAEKPSTTGASGQAYASKWEQLANVHQNDCPHNNWFFLPWHRVYLAYFESELIRALSDNGLDASKFALPYWNWTTTPNVPSSFYSGGLNPVELFKGKGPELEVARDVTASNALDVRRIGAPVIDSIIAGPDFYQFASYPSDGVNGPDDWRAGGSIENVPHNYVHGFIGGHMGNFLSPLDPIFWLHHCNVDRIWNLWMEKNPNVLPATLTVDSVTVGKDRFGRDIVVNAVVNDDKGNRITNYGEYWLNYQFQLDAGADGQPDFLLRGVSTREVLDSSLIQLPSNAHSKGYVYLKPGETLPSAAVASPSRAAFTSKLQTETKSNASSPRKAVIESYDLKRINQAASSKTFSSEFDLEPSFGLVKAYIEKRKRKVNASATAILFGVPFPPTPALRNALELRLYIADADRAVRDDEYRESFPPIAFFGHGDSSKAASHGAGHAAGHSRKTVNVSIDISDWLAKKDVTKLPKTIWLAARIQLRQDAVVPAEWETYKEALAALLLADATAVDLSIVTRTEI